MEGYQPELGELVAELRAERGFTSQQRLAEAAEIDVRTLGSLEGGEGIQPAKLGAICKELGVSIDELKRRAVERRQLNSRMKQLDQPSEKLSQRDWFAGVVKKLDEVDSDVNRAFGKLSTPTRASGSTDFSSRRLVASLTSLGIPPEVAFRLLDKLPRALANFVNEHEEMSTSHIRSAVAQLISELSLDDVAETDVFRLREEVNRLEGSSQGTGALSLEEIKFDWASRYARRYGNPSQILQVLEEDGQARKLDYAFIKGELIPHVLRRVLGDDFRIEEGVIVNPSIVSEMARTTLEEFRRLGLYSIRYRTALWLTEDIALHPPHPWVISAATRERTISYDFERARANLLGLVDDEDAPDFSLKHRFSEVVHHYCSAILGTYSGFLGHKHTSSLSILRHWLSIQDDNPVLWKRCELHLIESDLSACKISRQELNVLLKRIDVTLNLRSVPARGDLLEKAHKLSDYATRLHARRVSMTSLEKRLSENNGDDDNALAEIVREIAFSCFGARKVTAIENRATGKLTGFSATPAFEGTILAGRQPLCLFVFCNSFGSMSAQALCDLACDQLNAHRLADTCVTHILQVSR